MNTKQRLMSLLAASSLATLAPACRGTEPSETAEPEAQQASGGEAEAACGGGACGAVTSDAVTSDTEEVSQ